MATHHDRDINAAKNIRAFALIKHQSVRQEVPELTRSGNLASVEADVELRSHTPRGCGTSHRPQQPSVSDTDELLTAHI